MTLNILFLLAITIVLGLHNHQLKQLTTAHKICIENISSQINIEKNKLSIKKEATFFTNKLNQKIEIIKMQIAILEIVCNQIK